MDDLNELYYFVAVVQHNGFSAAARAAGIEKSRLSRHVALLEQRLGTVLMRRTTRSIVLTEAGERFYERCLTAVEGAQAAYDSIAELQKEPSGTVRVCCSALVAQCALTPLLPEYFAAFPKVNVVIDTSDNVSNLMEERIDLAIQARPAVESPTKLVTTEIADVRRILVASPDYLDTNGTPTDAEDLARFDTITLHGEGTETRGCWELSDRHHGNVTVHTKPRMVTGDVRVNLEAAILGVGIALLPQMTVAPMLKSGKLIKVLPHLSSSELILHMTYPAPRGMLPSVRSLIDYLRGKLQNQLISYATQSDR
jgi:DNA-binding transcriptional LysR family regulator